MNNKYFLESEVESVVNDSDCLSLPTRCYRDEKFYQLEKKHLMRAGWLCVGRIEQLKNPGDFFTEDLLGEPIVVLLGKDQKIKVLSRVCKHRAMLLLDGKKVGNCDSFVCPYHLWRYNIDGRLSHAPHMDKTKNFDKKNYRLDSFNVEVWHGFIFVNLDNQAQSLSSQLTDLDNILSQYNLADMKATAPITYESKWNWKVMVENASELYHLMIHRNTIMDLPKLEKTTVLESKGPYSICRFDANEKKPEEKSDLLLCNIFPCHLMVINPDQLTWIQVMPDAHDPDIHKVSFHFCFPQKDLVDPKFQARLSQCQSFLDRVHREDIDICTKVQEGLQTDSASRYQYSYYEQSLMFFHRWIVKTIEQI